MTIIINAVIIKHIIIGGHYEKKGYFKFFNNLLQLLVKIIINFSEEDIKMLENSIEPVFLILRNTLTDKNINLINNFIDNLKESEANNISTFKIIRELNSKEIRTNLYKILKSYKKTINKED